MNSHTKQHCADDFKIKYKMTFTYGHCEIRYASHLIIAFELALLRTRASNINDHIIKKRSQKSYRIAKYPQCYFS